MIFQPIHPASLLEAPFSMFDKGWALLSAGTQGNYNTMTVSWGTVGTLWNMPVASIYCRPQRHTAEYLAQNEFFSLSFFDGAYKQALGYLGSHSGRDGDKVAESGLTPLFDAATDAPYFAEAALVLVCRKLYSDALHVDAFSDATVITDCYPNLDFHQFYIGQVISAAKVSADD